MALRIITVCISSITFAFLSGCRTTGASSQVVDTLPPITCDVGEPDSFTFAPLEFTPPPRLVRFSGQPNLTFNLVPQNVDRGMYIRLDTCLIIGGNDDVILKRVILRQQAVSEETIYTVANSSVVQGLAKAIFEGDHSELNIRIFPVGEFDSTLLVSGWRMEDGRTFATATTGRIDGNRISSNSIGLLTGTVLRGDPLVSVTCPAGQIPSPAQFRIGTALFDTKLCYGAGGGETTAYTVTDLVITDSNPALPAEARAPQEFHGEESVRSVMNFRWNHHNACDSFYVKLPHSEYAATAAAMAGCGLPVENAPERNIEDERRTVLYRTKYSDGAWQDGSLPCVHFFFACPLPPPGPETESNSFLWHFTNHQWNSFDVNRGTLKLVIDTPQGDQAQARRNIGPGFRPNVTYNHYKLTDGSTNIEFAKWHDQPGNENARDIFCQIMGTVREPTRRNYPTTFGQLAENFGVRVTNAANTCPGTNIPAPDATPPDSFSRYTGDLICILTPRANTGSGPEFVGLYVPMRYSAEPVQPWLWEWPKATAQLCVDGTTTSLTNSDPR
jgi:hypothetical protein